MPNIVLDLSKTPNMYGCLHSNMPPRHLPDHLKKCRNSFCDSCVQIHYVIFQVGILEVKSCTDSTWGYCLFYFCIDLCAYQPALSFWDSFIYVFDELDVRFGSIGENVIYTGYIQDKNSQEFYLENSEYLRRYSKKSLQNHFYFFRTCI